jgi:hypothetical protein
MLYLYRSPWNLVALFEIRAGRGSGEIAAPIAKLLGS